MSFYIIPRPAPSVPSPPDQAASPGNSSAYAFTSKSFAEKFAIDSGSSPKSVVELDGCEFLDWLVQADRDETEFITVNADWEQEQTGHSRSRIALKKLMGVLADVLEDRLSEVRPNPPALEKVKLFHCQTCGAVTEQRTGRVTPTCCEKPMKLAAMDSVTVADGE